MWVSLAAQISTFTRQQGWNIEPFCHLLSYCVQFNYRQAINSIGERKSECFTELPPKSSNSRKREFAVVRVVTDQFKSVWSLNWMDKSHGFRHAPCPTDSLCKEERLVGCWRRGGWQGAGAGVLLSRLLLLVPPVQRCWGLGFLCVAGSYLGIYVICLILGKFVHEQSEVRAGVKKRVRRRI